MFKSFRIGTVIGIPIRLDITFLLILPIFAWVIGIQVEDLIELLNLVLGAGIDPDPLLVGNRPLYLGLAAAIGLFVGVVLHELGHSVVAIRYGYPIRSITLWLLGGLAELGEDPEHWYEELWIALAGPAVSVVLGVVCYLGMLAIPVGLGDVRFVLGYLALMNVFLAAFNMLPGFPMDGGRVLRALLARTRPKAQATEIAAEVGKTFALLFGLLGLFVLSPLMIALALFIYVAAGGEAKRAVVHATFEGVRVRDVMTPATELHTVAPSSSVTELFARMFRERHTGYPVLEHEELVGMVTFEDARTVPEGERSTTTVAAVMSTDVETIDPDAQAISALELMGRTGVGRFPVVDDQGDLVGLVTRTDLLRALTILRAGGRPGGPGRLLETGSDPLPAFTR